MPEDNGFTVPGIPQRRKAGAIAEKMAADMAANAQRVSGLTGDAKPDEIATAARVSDRSGLPMDAARGAVRADPFGARSYTERHAELLHENPILASWLSNPTHNAIGEDDIPGLVEVTERSRAAQVSANFWGALKSGGANTFVAAVHTGVAEGMIPREQGAMLVSRASALAKSVTKPPEQAAFEQAFAAESPGAQTAVEDALDGLSKAGRDAWDSFIGGTQRAINRTYGTRLEERAAVDANRSAVNAAVDTFRAVDEMGDLVDAALANKLGAAYMTGENLPNSALALLGASLGSAVGPEGVPVGLFIGEGITEEGSWINERMTERGTDLSDQAAVLALYQDQAFMEQARGGGRRKAIGTAGSDALLAFFGLGTIGEIVSEGLTEGIGEFNATGKVDVPGAMLETMLGVPEAVGTAALTAPKTVEEQALAKEQLRVAVEGKEAAQQVAAVTQAGEAVAASKAATRLPEAVRALVEAAGPGVAPTVERAVWDTFWTGQGKSPATEAERLGATYPEVGEVSLPWSRVAEDVATLAPMLPDMRFRPDLPTVRESQEEAKAVQGAMVAAAEEAANAPPSPDEPTEGDARRSEIEAELGVPEGASLLFQSGKPEPTEGDGGSGPPDGGSRPPTTENATSDPLRAAADAIEAAPKAPGVVGRLLGKPAQPVADAVRQALGSGQPEAAAAGVPESGDRPSPEAGVSPAVQALAAAAQRDPAGTAARLRELADIRDRQGPAPLVAKLTAAIRAAGGKKPAEVARILTAFVETMRARFPDVPAAKWDALMVRFAKGEAPSGALEQQARTIDVGGVQRPTTNSLGQPIHPTEEGTRAFWRWFGDSKVVDDKGQPVVVYHGTNKRFTVVNPKKGAQGLFWFTSNRAGIDAGEVGASGAGITMELYAKLASPADWEQYGKLGLYEYKGRGLDGAILPNDGGFDGFALRSDQIKSATRNRGTFDASDPSILHQQARGAYDRATRTIHLFETADASTAIHESGHFIRDTMRAMAADPESPPALREMAVDIDKAFGVEPGAEWTVPQEEKFAESFEAYIHTGVAPSASLRRAFAVLRSVMLKVYQTVQQILGVDAIPAKTRAIFDRMLATDAEIAAAEAETELTPLFATTEELENAGLTPEDAAKHMKLVRDARDAAVEKVSRKVMAAITAEKVAEADALLDGYREQIAAKVDETPAMVAYKALHDGDVQLSAAAVDETFPEGKTAQKLRKIGVAAEAGMTPQAAAELYGFATPDALADGLILAANPQRLIDKIARDRLAAEHPELVMNREQIAAEARKAVISNERERVLSAQLRVLMESQRKETRKNARAEKAEREVAGVAARGDLAAQAARAKAEKARQVARDKARLLKEAQSLKDANRIAEATAAAALAEREAQDAERDAFIAGRKQGRTEGSAPVAGLTRRAVKAETANAAGDAARQIEADLRAASILAIPNLEATRDAAHHALAGKSYRDIKPHVYKLAVQREGRKAKYAFGAGDIDNVAKALKAQAINLALFREAERLVEQSEKDASSVRLVRSKGRQEAVADGGHGFAVQMNKVAARFGLGAVRADQAAAAPALREWLATLEKEAAEANSYVLVPDVPQWIVASDGQPPVNWRDLTPDQIHDVRETVEQLYTTGRNIGRALAGDREESLQTQADAFKERIIASREPLTREFQAKPTGTQRLIAENAPIDRYVYEMDGGPGGPGAKAILFPRNEGDAAVEKMRRVVNKDINSAFKNLPLSQQARIGVHRTIAGVHVPLSRENVMVMAAYEGTETGRQRNRVQFTDEEVKAALRTLTKGEAAWVNAIWAAQEKWWAPSKDLMERNFGNAPPKLEAMPFVVVNDAGETLEFTGGYTKVKYHGDRAAQMSANDVAREMKQGAAMRRTVTLGSRFERVVESGLEVRYDFGVAMEGLGETITALGKLERLHDINFVLRDDGVRSEIINRYGQEVYDQFKAAMLAYAGQRLTVQSAQEQWNAWIRSGTTVSLLGLKASTNLLNMTGIANSVDVYGAEVLSEATYLSANPHLFVQAVREMWADSDEMATRNTAFNREEVDSRQKLERFLRLHAGPVDVAVPIPDALKAIPMLPLALTQLWVDTPTYRVAKRAAIAGGADEQTAIRMAVQGVKDTQGSGLPADIPQIMRTHKYLTLFMGFANRTLNLAIRRKRMGGKGLPAIARLGASLLVLYLLPKAAEMAFRASRGDDDDDPWWLSLGKETATSIAGGNVITNLAGQAIRFGRATPAEFAVYEKIGRGTTEWFDGEWDEKDAETAMSVAGILLHLPSAQAIETWRGLRAYLDGDAGPQAAVLGPPRGRR